MTKVESIEKEIESLNRDELTALRRWFFEYDSAAWDREIQTDIESGKLERLADAALDAHTSGKSREL